MKEFIFTWSIKNINHSWHKTGQRIASPTFLASSLQNSAWILCLYPRGRENSDNLSLYLCRDIREDQGPEDVAVNVEYSCITADTSKVQNFTPEVFTNFTKDRFCGLTTEFIPRHEVFGRRKALYLPRDTLALQCRMWMDDGDVNEFGHSFGCTQLEIERIVLVEYICIENSVEETFEIQSKLKNKALMSISILFCGDMIDVGINPINGEKMKVSTCDLSLVDERTGRKVFEHKICFFGRPYKNVWRFPFSDKLLPSENDDSDNSNYKFIAEFVYSTGEENKIIRKDCPVIFSEFLSNYTGWTPSGYLTDCPNISEDLCKLVVDKDLYDLKLKVQNTSFSVHRIVLCARSPVFLAMLTGAMKEKEYGFIDIVDVSADTVYKFLRFLYCDGIVLLNWNVAIELYYTADKYQVEGLKFLCCSYLLQNIDVNNFYEILMLADRHHDYELKQKVNNIIWKNDEIFFTSPTWKKFADDHQQLAMETMLSKYEEKENQNSAETYDEKISNHPKIQDDLRSLYESRIASDIVIKTASASYPTYKTVLCASSLIFKGMLLKESIDFIKIEDFEDDTVSTMLFFLHSDKFEGIQWDIAKKLYHASVVYQIHRLKFQCSCFFLKSLRVSNACELLLLAHEHNDLRLKSAVEDYIGVYDDEIFRSDEWAEFCETNSHLAFETMRRKYRSN